MMGDLIDRSEMLDAIDKRERIARKLLPDLEDDELRPTLKSLREFIANRPAVDAEPVRSGTWEIVPVGVNGHITAYHGCSACGCVFKSPSHYCPNCGAKMDGGATGNENRDH